MEAVGRYQIPRENDGTFIYYCSVSPDNKYLLMVSERREVKEYKIIYEAMEIIFPFVFRFIFMTLSTIETIFTNRLFLFLKVWGKKILRTIILTFFLFFEVDEVNKTHMCAWSCDSSRFAVTTSRGACVHVYNTAGRLLARIFSHKQDPAQKAIMFLDNPAVEMVKW